VRADKLREVQDGHDGTWVAHPGLVALAKEVFDAHMPGPHQIERRRDDVHVEPRDLLEVPSGTRTEAGVRHNVRVAVRYLAAWLAGSGCVPIDHLMEDAATAEIARVQLWQWLRHGAILEHGRTLDRPLFQTMLEQEMLGLAASRPPDDLLLRTARELFERLVTSSTCGDFLTIPAYELLTDTK
jgi:malate synthase